MSSEFEYQVRRGLDAVYNAFPKLKRHMAQDKQIREVCNQFAGREVVPTPDLYTLAIEESYSAPKATPSSAVIDYTSASVAQMGQQIFTEKEEQNRRAWEHILSLYDVASHEANFSVVKQYCGGEITLAKFEFMVQNKHAENLDWRDERGTLLEQIKERLHDPYGRRMTALDLKSQMMKYQYMNRMQLREVLARITDRQTTAAKSVSQIQSEIQPELQARRVAAGVEVQPGRKVLPAEITAAAIHAMPSKQIQKLLRDWGSAVNDRLFGRS